MKHSGTFFAGVICGALLFGGVTAYASGIIAEPGTQKIIIDGNETRLESYMIDGHNYLQLRDIGQAVGFNVWWDDATCTVQIDSNQPYTGSRPEGLALEEYSAADLNAAVLNGVYTREAYAALRSAIVSGTESEPVYMSEETHQAMIEAIAAIGCYPVYDLESKGNRIFTFSVRYPAPYEEAAAYCRSFIAALANQTDREKIRQMAFFVCDRIDYVANAYCSPRTALVSDEIQKGSCMSYAHCFKFLCDMGGIPCILVHSDKHQWNLVFLEGKWWHIDVSSVDVSDISWRPKLTLLKEDSEMQGSMYLQSQPLLIGFFKELLVPGSTTE